MRDFRASPPFALYILPFSNNAAFCQAFGKQFTEMEQCSCIKIKVARGHSAKELWRGLHGACGDDALSY
jgi:hypothetical protein